MFSWDEILGKDTIGTEKELIKFIRESPYHDFFWHERLKNRIESEKEAWNLLSSNFGNINPEILDEIFNKFPKRLGPTLNKPNKGKIFSTPNDKLNNWFNYLLNGKEPEPERIEKCLVDPKWKIKGAHKVLITLLLYLKDPKSFNVMMNPTIDGLEKLGRFNSKMGKRRWRDYYNDYNTAANEFRERYELEPQSIDWVLDLISRPGIVRTDDDFVHVTKDLIEKALDELGIKEGEATKIELLTTLRKIVERDGNKLVDDETAWKEILNLLKNV
jgi:hypothetical protein